MVCLSLLGGRAVGDLDYYSESYAESLDRFQGALPAVRERWPGAMLEKVPLGVPEEGPAMHILTAPAAERPEKALIVTAGLHGMEGYAGSAVLQQLIAEFLPCFDPAGTGLILVHALNPWGMEQRRRTNAENVDLNRNFTGSSPVPARDLNPGYSRAESFFNPCRPAGGAEYILFWIRLARALMRLGAAGLKESLLLGQYRHPEGLYYGGTGPAQTAKIFERLFKQATERYGQILLVDLHTGYGPRGKITIVCSPLEKKGAAALREALAFPRVAKTTAAEFYRIEGDMVDYCYSLHAKLYPENPPRPPFPKGGGRHFHPSDGVPNGNGDYPAKHFFGCALEIGTLGDSLAAGIRSMRAMIMENAMYHHGAASERVARRVRRDFEELFFPRDAAWRRSALQDSRLALAGILHAGGFLRQGLRDVPYVPRVPPIPPAV